MATRRSGWGLPLLLTVVGVAGLFLLPGAASAEGTVGAPAENGSYLSAGGHAGWLFDPGRGSRGFTAEALFRPGAVAQFSARLAKHRLGLCLRYNRSLVVHLVRLQGAEICLRRGLGRAEAPVQPFLELGVGQYQVDYERLAGDRSTWSGLLGLGVERLVGERWLVQAALHLRSLEFANESLTQGTFTLTFGGRIDS